MTRALKFAPRRTAADVFAEAAVLAEQDTADLIAELSAVAGHAQEIADLGEPYAANVREESRQAADFLQAAVNRLRRITQ